MRTHSIALIAGPARVAASDLLEELFRHWPPGVPTPRLDPVSPAELLRGAHKHKAWDAAVLVVPEDAPDSTWLRVADTLQQAMVPLLLLTPGPVEQMESFHPGAVLTQSTRADPRVTAAMLSALASRQTAVRSMEQSLRLAQSFQGETAAEIDRLHTELLLAARVQRDFLPKHMPELPGVGASVLFRPHGFVSGDTYDVRQVDEHHVSFFLADAMGHGVPAALMTLYIAGSLPRVEAGPNGLRVVPPAEALSHLNNELHGSLGGPARFATAVCGVIDLRTRTISLACAGHPAPLRVGRHGVKPVEVSGMLMGVVADYAYEQVSVRLEEGELLVLHSDGLECAFSPRPNAAGVTAAAGPVPPHYHHIGAMRRGPGLRGLEEALDALAEAIDSQAGSFHQDDDLTVLAFEMGDSAADTRGSVGKPRSLLRD